MIVRLVIRNFQCFEGEHVVVLFSGVNVIIGPNSVGKTAFVEAISWAHFGARAIRRGRSEDDVVHDDADEVFVRVEYDDGPYVERSRKRGGGRRLEVFDGTVKKYDRSASAAVESLLGCDAKTYGWLVHVSQRRVSQLLDARDAERRKTLMGAIDDGHWKKMVERVVGLVEGASSESMRRQGAVRELQSQVVDDDLVEVQNALSIAVDADERLREYDEAVRVETERSELHERVAILRRQFEETALEVHEPDVEEHDDVRARQTRASDELERIDQLLSHGFDSVCPVTLLDCPCAESVDEQLHTLEVKRVGVVEARDEARDDREQMNAEVRRARSDRDSEARRRAEWNECARQLSQIGDVTHELMDENAVSDAESLVETIPPLESRIETIRISRGVQERLVELEAARSGHEREERATRLLLRALKAIPGPVAALRDEIEDAASALLSYVGVSVQIEWDAPTTGGTTRCSCGCKFEGSHRNCPECRSPRMSGKTDKVSIVVRHDDRVDPVEACGGLGDVVCLALLLSAAYVGGRVRASWRVLDEPGIHLRGVVADGFSEMLARLDDVGVDQVIVVTNRSVVSEKHHHVVEVCVGDDGVRTIVCR